MKPAIVVDVGNSFIKWGRCADGAVAERAFLPPDDPTSWQQQATEWNLPAPAGWAIASVHPERSNALATWLLQRGDDVVVLNTFRQLPLSVLVAEPDCVGIDRLLDA